MMRLIKDITNYRFNISPDYLIAFVTDRCNLKCYHCFNPNKASDLDPELLINAINSCSWKNVTLTGGETFLYQELAHVLENIKSDVQTFTIPTNGLITKNIINTLDEITAIKPQANFNISVSIDGPMNIHNQIRNNAAAYDNAIKTIQELSDLKSRRKNISVCINTVISTINIDYLEQTLTALNKEPIDYHDFEIIRNHPGMDLDIPSMSQLNDAKSMIVNNFLKFSSKAKFRKKIDKNIYELIYDEKIKIINTNKSKFLCKAPYIYAIIQTNGDVSYCEFKPPIGNLENDSFLNIWNSPAGIEQRSMIRKTRCCCPHGCFLPLNMKLDPRTYAQAAIRVLYDS